MEFRFSFWNKKVLIELCSLNAHKGINAPKWLRLQLERDLGLSCGGDMSFKRLVQNQKKAKEVERKDKLQWTNPEKKQKQILDPKTSRLVATRQINLIFRLYHI